MSFACWDITGGGGRTQTESRKITKGMSRSSERLGCLLFLLAEEAEALLLVLLLVFLTLAGAGVARQGDGGRERVSAAGGRRALIAGRDLRFLGGR